MARVLIIEDEADVGQVLEYNLTQSGYEALLARDGRTGLRLARETKPDVILLDLMLPDVRGTDVCRELKKDPATRKIPLVIVSALGDEVDRVVGFELGADDYITKPFSVRELLLRVRAVLRRPSPTTSSGSIMSIGELRVDREAHRVWVGGEEVELTAVQFKLLTVLCERGNRVQTREALLEHVWGNDTQVAARTVDAHVKRLREKLGGARSYIETVRGVGYRLAESVRNQVNSPG